MVAATITVNTEGVGFTIDAQVGTIDGDGRTLDANAPTMAGALRQLADKIDRVAAGKTLPDDVVEQIATIVHNGRAGRRDYDILGDVRKILAGEEPSA